MLQTIGNWFQVTETDCLIFEHGLQICWVVVDGPFACKMHFKSGELPISVISNWIQNKGNKTAPFGEKGIEILEC